MGMISRWLGLRATPMPVQAANWAEVIGLRSDAGTVVSPASALGVSTVQACVGLIARSLASVPLVLYRRTADGGRTPAEDHPLFTLLHDLANPTQTAYEVREALFVSALLYGNGYAEIEWGEDGYPRALWPLSPDQVQVYVSPQREVIYHVSGDMFGVNGRVRWLPAWRMHHLRGLATQGVLGMSPLRAANAIGLAIATEEFGARFFAQGARPGVVLRHPAKLSADAASRIRQAWNDLHAGVNNSHRAAVLEEGMDITPLGVPPEEAQFLQTRAFQVAEICRIFNISPGLVGATETQTYASAEQDLIRFRELCLKPWADNHVQAVQRDCLVGAEQRGYFVDYVLSDLQMTDLKARYEAHQIALLTGFMTQNEVRAAENLNPIDGGDALWRPLNMGTTGDALPVADPAPDSAPADDQRAALLEQAGLAADLTTAWVADVRARLEARIANDVRQAGAKALRQGGRSALGEWGETMMHEWRTAGEGMLTALNAVRPAAGPDVAAWVAASYQASVRELIGGGANGE